MLTKFTCIKHKNNVSITLPPGTYIFVLYGREMVNQKVNIILKIKIKINLNRKSD